MLESINDKIEPGQSIVTDRVEEIKNFVGHKFVSGPVFVEEEKIKDFVATTN